MLQDFGWHAAVIQRPEIDGYDCCLRRRTSNGFVERVTFRDGKVTLTRIEHGTICPRLFEGVDRKVIEALADGLREALGQPEKERRLEDRAMAAEAARAYACDITDRLLGIIERKFHATDSAK